MVRSAASTASTSAPLAEGRLTTYAPVGHHSLVTTRAVERGTRRPLRVPARLGSVALAALAALPLALLLGQRLTCDRARTVITAPPPIRARFDAICRLVRPDAASLPVAIEKAPPSQRPDGVHDAWMANWASPGSNSTGVRIVLTGRTGRVLLIGGDLRTGIAAAGDEEGEGAGAIRTSEEAVRTARRYLLWLGERAAPSAPFTAQYLPSKGIPSGVWRLASRCPEDHRTGMLLDAKTGTLLYFFWNATPPKD